MAATLAKTRCTYSAEQVYDYALDASEGGQHPEFQAHLDCCKICSTLFEQYRHIGKSLEHIGARAPVSLLDENTLTPAPATASSPSAPPISTPKSKSLGPYEIISELGRGGMGIVLKARDKALNREIALKVMRADGYKNDEWRKRFIEEAQITGQLEHPGVAPVHLLGANSKGYEFFSMKLMSGRTLAQILKALSDKKRDVLREYTLARLLSVFERVCETVEFAHSRGVLHRDLKPANIMVGDHGEVWVLDWGLAKLISAQARDGNKAGAAVPAVKSIRDASGDLTTAGSIVGTPAYMSPEQASGEKLDEGADIYSLGAILYEILTGGLPVEGNDVREILLRTVKGRIKHVRSTRIGKNVPKGLAAICMKCLSHRRKDRYLSAIGLIQDLRAYASGDAVSALPDRGVERLLRYVNRNKVKVAVTAALAVLICGVVTVASIVVANEQRRARVAESEKNAAEGQRLKAEKQKLEAESAAAATEKIAAAKEKAALNAVAKAKDAEAKSAQEQLAAERAVKAALAEKVARAQRRSDAFEPYARATDLLGRGQKFEDAERLARRALEIDPDFVEAQFTLAEALRAQGLPKEAAEAYIKTDELSNNVANKPNIKALLSAAFMYESSDYFLSLATFNRIEAIGGDDPLVDVARSFVRMDDGRLAEAEALLANLRQKAPYLWEVYFAQVHFLAMAANTGYTDQGQAGERALTILAEGLKIAPQQTLLMAAQANITRDLKAFDAVIAREPKNGALLLERSLARVKLGVPGAEEDLAAAQRLGVSPVMAKRYEYLLRNDQGRSDLGESHRAELEFARASGTPRHLGFAIISGIALNRYQEVSALHELIQRKYPLLHETFVSNALLLNLNSKASASSVKARDGLKIYPFSSQLWNILGCSLFNTRNYQDALEAVENSIRYTSPGRPEFKKLRDKLLCLLNLNRTAEARETIAEIEKLHPDDAKTKLAQERATLKKLENSK
jgi:serine/threonine protein kinase